MEFGTTSGPGLSLCVFILYAVQTGLLTGHQKKEMQTMG